MNEENICMLNDMLKGVLMKVAASLLGAAIVAAVTWTYTSNDRITVIEQQIHTLSDITATNTKHLSAMQLRMSEQNEEIVNLLSKQDNRLTKLETIIEIVTTQPKS